MNADLFSGLQATILAPAPSNERDPSGALRCTVSQLNAQVKEMLEGVLPPAWVQGEVTGWKRYPSGHCYFSLRDASAQVRCVMFRSDAQRLPADPEEGMQVRALGRVSLYERRGEFQLIVREIEGSGAGGLWRLAVERLVAKLKTEGLLEPERRRAIPRCPARVGVVTSPVGAALHDVLTVIGRRAPWTRVVLSPAKVQGDGAAEDIARAIRLFSRVDAADVLIVGRGGGSMEDLWAFNTEIVVRAIAECPIPVIAAVGHEVDVTVADLVADLRAATPSAAAECAVPDVVAVERQIARAAQALAGASRRRFTEARGQLRLAADGLQESLLDAVRRRQEGLARIGGRLDALSPLSTLSRGYAVALDAEGRVKRRAADFTPGESVRLRVVDGSVDCHVSAVEKDGQETGS